MISNSLLGSLITLSFFIGFVGICIWALNPKNKEKFRSYGNIPLKEDQEDERA